MSIATDEAVRIYPLKGHSDEAYERCMVSRVDYVRGRTAPVTEAETEAATRAFYDAVNADDVIRWDYAEDAFVTWEELTDRDRKHYCLSMRIALSAARKQVTQ